MRKHKFYILEVIIGLLMIALAVLTVLRPSSVLGSFTRFYAIMTFISGIRDIVFYCKSGRYTGYKSVISLVSSIIVIMTGIILFIYPNAGSVIISILIPLWFISHSVFQIVSLDIIKKTLSKEFYIFLMILCIIGLVVGVITLFNPLISLKIMSIIASYLMITGIISIAIGLIQLELEV